MLWIDDREPKLNRLSSRAQRGILVLAYAVPTAVSCKTQDPSLGMTMPEDNGSIRTRANRYLLIANC
jgi:hypothetical protein